MRYQDAIRLLYGLKGRGVRLGIDRIEAALAVRGDPHRAGPAVHVGGTNGKGSVSTMISTALREAGISTGLFTSPHLHRFVERIRIDGRPMREAVLAARVSELWAAMGSGQVPALSFFETAALLAFETFRDAKCGVSVYEVGLGGRLDATNVITPSVAVITGVSLEHQRILGDTIAKIAREKAGIIKPGVPVVVGTRLPEARRVIQRRAHGLGAPVWMIGRDFDVTHEGHRFGVQLGVERYSGLTVGLRGDHQRDNAACAVAALHLLRERGFGIPDAAIVRGLSRARWAGRLERVPGSPPCLLDAAHNAEACQVLATYLASRPRRGKRVLVFGAMRDKTHGPMLDCLGPQVDDMIFAAPKIDRAMDPRALSRLRGGRVARSVREALGRARRSAGPDGLVVVAGSIFTVAEARQHLLGVRAEPAIGL